MMKRPDDEPLAAAVEGALRWITASLVRGDPAGTDAFFALVAREQFIAVEALRLAVRSLLDAFDVDVDAFVSAFEQEFASWLLEEPAPLSDLHAGRRPRRCRSFTCRRS